MTEEKNREQIPSQEGKTGVEDRPEKNWKAEMDRKLGQKDEVIQGLQDQIEEIKQTQTASQAEKSKESFEEEVSSLSYLDEDDAKKLVGMMGKAFDEKISHLKDEISKENEPMMRQVYTSSRDRHFKDIVDEDTTGLVAKNKDDIKSVVDKLSPEVWGNKEAMRNAVNMVLGKMLPDILGKKTEKIDSPTETDLSEKPVKKKAGKADEKRVDQITAEYGVDEDKSRSMAESEKELDKTMFSK